MAIAFETTNRVKGPSTIRFHGVGTANINVQNTFATQGVDKERMKIKQTNKQTDRQTD